MWHLNLSAFDRWVVFRIFVTVSYNGLFGVQKKLLGVFEKVAMYAPNRIPSLNKTFLFDIVQKVLKI